MLDSLSLHAQGQQRLCFAPSATPSVSSVAAYADSSWGPLAAPPAAPGTIAWSLLRAGNNDQRFSLVSMTTSRALVRHEWDGTSWSGTTTVTADTGQYGSRVFDAEHERSSGDQLLVYRKANDTSVYYRVIGASVSNEQTFAMALNAPPRWIELTPRRGSDEMMLLVATDTRLYAAAWNGAAFEGLQTLTTSLPPAGRPFAAAYENTSGEALVAWGRRGAGPQYRTRSGTTWGAITTLPGGTEVGWLAMSASRASGSDDVLVATLDSARDIRAMRWDGASWSSATVFETNAGAAGERRLDLAHEPDGSHAVLAWHAAGTTLLRYRSFTGGAWSSQQTTSNLGSEPLSVHLEAGPAPSGIAAAVRRRGAVSFADYVMYSTSGSVSSGSASVYGSVGSGGVVALPAAPSGSSNSNNITISNNGTRSLAPGSYGYISVGNSATINLVAGDYFIEYFGGGSSNGTRFRFDTSGGDIRLVLTNGNFQSRNNLAMSNTGGGRVGVYVKNGSIQVGSDAAVSGVELYALNGNIEFGSNASVSGAMYASGNVQVNSGFVSVGHTLATPPDPLSAIIFTDGVAATPSTVSTSINSISSCDAFSLSGLPSAQAVRVVRWREVAEDE